MPTIQSADIWKESGRYNDYGEEMLRIKDRQVKVLSTKIQLLEKNHRYQKS